MSFEEGLSLSDIHEIIVIDKKGHDSQTSLDGKNKKLPSKLDYEPAEVARLISKVFAEQM